MPRLYYHATPYVVTQAWGIKNPSYEQFGYSRHNGEDCRIGDDNKLWWPLELCEVYDTSYGQYTGWRIKANSTKEYLFPDGKRAYINVIMMHMDSQSPLKVGQIVDVGDYVGVPDNTGFSTGPHTHVMFRRVDKYGNLMDKNDADNSFDPHPFWTGFNARDAKSLVAKLTSLISILKSVVGLLSAKK